MPRFLPILLSFLPGLTLAAPLEATSIKDWVNSVVGYVNVWIVGGLVTLCLVAFFYGVVRTFAAGDNPGVKESGRWYMLWGIIALTVIFSLQGIFSVLNNTFGF